MPNDPYDKQYKDPKTTELHTKLLVDHTARISRLEKDNKVMRCTIDDLCGKMGRFEADRQQLVKEDDY